MAILPFSFSAENPQLNHIYIFNSRSQFGNIAKPQTLVAMLKSEILQ